MQRFVTLLCCGLLLGCNTSTTPEPKSVTLALGDLNRCQNYSGLPPEWGKAPYAGMQYIAAGEFTLGSNLAYADERNFGTPKRVVAAFWMDQTEVTVAQFAQFVAATGYITDAEQQQAAAVFSPDPKQPKDWWQLKSGYSWKMPHGPQGQPAAMHEAVRFVTKNDAEHYALWLGHDLPSEIEWEYAAKAQDQQDHDLKHEPQDHTQRPTANYWQGDFPFHNRAEDHFADVAPVGCFAANSFGLYDMIGNVWEWTQSPYQGAHDQHMGNYQQLRQQQRSGTHYVIKGGSFLCASQYCARYRNSSRHPQEFDLATSHVGFRTIVRVPHT